MADTLRLAQLRENLVEYFDLEELRTLSFDLGVDWDRTVSVVLPAVRSLIERGVLLAVNPPRAGV